jgi:hypothetical protein
MRSSPASVKQILEDALRSADSALKLLKPRARGSGIMTPPPEQPDSPRLLAVREEPRDVEMALAMRPPALQHSNSEMMPFDWYKHTADSRRHGGGSDAQSESQEGQRQLQRNMSYNPPGGGGGPEPFSLEKIWREPASDVDSGMDAIALDDLPNGECGPVRRRASNSHVRFLLGLQRALGPGMPWKGNESAEAGQWAKQARRGRSPHWGLFCAPVVAV